MTRPELKARHFYSNDLSSYQMNQIARSNLKANKTREVRYYVGIAANIIPFVKFDTKLSMVCMGTRNNNERDTISHQLNGVGCLVSVSSVDIAPNSNADFVFDFNKCPDDWENKWDILFSNSIDHAVDASDTFYEWMRTVKQGGIMVLHIGCDTEPSDSDCCAFTHKDLDEFAHSENDVFELLFEDEENNIFVFRKI